MKSYSLPTKFLVFSTLLATAAGCGSDDGSSASDKSTLKGRVSDGSGSQPQSLTPRVFGGSGSVTAAVKVRASQLKADGSLEVMAEGAIKSDGRYELAVTPGQRRLIAESLDISGNVVASAIVEASGSAGAAVTVTPMDSESSIEAAVLAQMAASGVALAEINAIDLRERINLNVAVAVKASADANVKIKALAVAVAAAQSAKIKAYASAGLNTSQSALFDAELAASQKLDIALDASASGSTTDQAYASFHTDLDASLMALDGSVKKHARAESVASVAFRATVKARLSASGDAVADASLRAAASSEARISAAAVDAILTAGAASAEAATAAKTAATTLRTQITASTSVMASAMAYGSWNTSLSGSTVVTGSVLGNYLGVTATTATAAQASVTAVATAATTLDTSLKAATGALSATGNIDFNVLAQSIVTAYSAFQASIDLQATALTVFGTKAQTALDVMATASGSFRMQ